MTCLKSFCVVIMRFIFLTNVFSVVKKAHPKILPEVKTYKHHFNEIFIILAILSYLKTRKNDRTF